MARHARVPSSTGYYHIIVRGNNKENILGLDKYKKKLLDYVKQKYQEEKIELIAWCLMDNHAHFVLKAELENLARVMRRVNTKYALYYNAVNQRSGHVFQDRFRSENIESDEYLMQVVRYVHNNPVKANLTPTSAHYKWSSFIEYLEDNKYIDKDQKDFVLNYFNGNMEKFKQFHECEDNGDYLEIKEDKEKYRLDHAQQIISKFCNEKGITKASQIYKNSILLEEIIVRLLLSSNLSYSKIAKLIGVTESKVYRISLTNKCEVKTSVPNASRK